MATNYIMAGQQDIDTPVVEINPRDGLKSMASFILGGVGKRPCKCYQSILQAKA